MPSHGAASRTYPVASPHPGWAETDPVLWERAAQDAVAELLGGHPDAEVVAVGIDGQMHGTVLVDEDGRRSAPASCGRTPARATSCRGGTTSRPGSVAGSPTR